MLNGTNSLNNSVNSDWAVSKVIV